MDFITMFVLIQNGMTLNYVDPKMFVANQEPKNLLLVLILKNKNTKNWLLYSVLWIFFAEVKRGKNDFYGKLVVYYQSRIQPFKSKSQFRMSFFQKKKEKNLFCLFLWFMSKFINKYKTKMKEDYLPSHTFKDQLMVEFF